MLPAGLAPGIDQVIVRRGDVAEASYVWHAESGVLMISPTANPATCFSEWMAAVTGHALVTEGSVMTRRGSDRTMGETGIDLRGSAPLAECG